MVESEEEDDDATGFDIVEAALPKRSVVGEDASAKGYLHGCHGIDFGERSAPRLPFPRSRGHASVPPIVNSNIPMCH